MSTSSHKGTYGTRTGVESASQFAVAARPPVGAQRGKAQTMRLKARGLHGEQRARHSPPRVGSDPASADNGRSEGGRQPRVHWITWFVSRIVYRCGAERNVRGSTPRVIARWALWTQPLQAVIWLMVMDTAVLIWAVAGALADGVSRGSLLRFVVLLVCASAHVFGTREPEERRRYADRGTEHVDQTSIWLFTAALALPVSLVLALVLAVRAQRYLIARKPWHTFVFTSAAITASALAVHEVAILTPLGGWFSMFMRAGHQSAEAMAIALGGLAGAVAVYFAAQALLVGTARGLITGRWSLPDLLGDTDTNLFILATLGLAVVAAVVLAFLPLLELAMLPVALRATHVEQGLRQKTADNDKLLVDAFHDHLTTLLNRRGFDPEANMYLTDDQVEGRPSAVVFVDIDHFKAWNDRLGHIGGDVLLKAVASVMRRNTRDKDVLCRWGGEEMVALLPATGRQEALDIAERIRAAVEDLQLTIGQPAGDKRVQLNHNGVPSCTVSLGVALSPEHGTDLDALKGAADRALYRAKSGGRNRVVLATESSHPESASVARTTD